MSDEHKIEASLVDAFTGRAPELKLSWQSPSGEWLSLSTPEGQQAFRDYYVQQTAPRN
jgi:hypothetical protein